MSADKTPEFLSKQLAKTLAEYGHCKEALAHAWKMLEIANLRLRNNGLRPINNPRDLP